MTMHTILKQLIGACILLVAVLRMPAPTVLANDEPVSNPKLLPHVITAQAPLYPEILQKAHFEGIVRLRVTTDGKRPSTITIIDGPIGTWPSRSEYRMRAIPPSIHTSTIATAPTAPVKP